MLESLGNSGTGPGAEGGGGSGDEDFSQALVCQLSIIWAYQLHLASD